MNYSKELDFAKNTAYEAGEIMKKYYRGDQHVKIKEDHSPVTIADQTINDHLIERVKKTFPEYGVLGEEANWNEDSQNVWVCDPIDGTVAYVLHIPVSMFSLALVENGRPVVAVAYNPWTDELYWSVKNYGSWRNDEKIKVSDKSWGPGVRLLGSSGKKPEIEKVDQLQEQLGKQGFYVSNTNGTVFKGCMIAEGSAEARSFMHDGAHDVAAIKLIIEEAGGKVTDLDGNDQRYDKPVNGCVMTNAIVHKEFLELINS